MLSLECKGTSVLERTSAHTDAGAVEEIAAVELDTWLIGKDLQEAAALLIPDRACQLDILLRCPVEHPVVVIAAGVGYLDIIGAVYPFTYPVRCPEVERSPLDTFIGAQRDAERVYRCEFACIDSHHIVADSPHALSPEIEERMV